MVVSPCISLPDITTSSFKAFIAHCGIFNMEMQYYNTEEMWFANWDMGGALGKRITRWPNARSTTLLTNSWENGTPRS